MKNTGLLALSSFILLSGCAQYSEDLSSLDKTMTSAIPTQMANALPQNISPAAGVELLAVQPPQDTVMFSKLLAQEYYTLAKYENDQAYDYKAAQNFTQKAMKAMKGDAVEPSKISAFDIPEESFPELEKARSQLMAALKTQNTPQNAQIMAVAQTKFECWLDRAEDAKDESHLEPCKQEFGVAMSGLNEQISATHNMFDVAFVANKTQIDDQSIKILSSIEQFLKDPANAEYKAQLMGVSSASQNPYAVELATARVKELKTILVSKGISPDKISEGLSPVMLSDGNAGKVQVMMIAPQPMVQTTMAKPMIPFVQHQKM